MELINRMFAGELPPMICPRCGHELVKLPQTIGQVIEDTEMISDVKSISLARKNKE